MPTYSLRKEFKFEASHVLPNHDGKCSRLHGHSWRGWVIVEGNTLENKGPKVGMLIDYGAISMAMKPMIENFLDHYHLNDSIPGMQNPTSECIAKWVFDYLNTKIPMLAAIEINETCTSACTYRPIK